MAAKPKPHGRAGTPSLTAEQINRIMKDAVKPWLKAFFERSKQFEGKKPEALQLAASFAKPDGHLDKYLSNLLPKVLAAGDKVGASLREANAQEAKRQLNAVIRKNIRGLRTYDTKSEYKELLLYLPANVIRAMASVGVFRDLENGFLIMESERYKPARKRIGLTVAERKRLLAPVKGRIQSRAGAGRPAPMLPRILAQYLVSLHKILISDVGASSPLEPVVKQVFEGLGLKDNPAENLNEKDS